MLAVLGAAIVLWQQPWRGDGDASDAVATLPADAPALLTSQLRDLSQAGTENAFVDAFGDLPAAERLGGRTWRSMRAVAAPGATFRYVSGGDVADRSDGSAAATVDVSWRASASSGLDPAVARTSTIVMRIAPQADGALSLVGAERAKGDVPIWLLGDVTVDPAGAATVVRIDGGDGSLPVDDMTAAARTAVERAVPGVEGGLTIVSPRTQGQMAAVVGQGTDAIAQIAAVSTGIAGDSTAQDPVVVLNPAVFASMDRRAAQVVLTHEATHVLTRAVGTQVANWVVEGFADFVALRDDTAPLSISAGQVLAEVRAGRLPRALPADTDFGSTQHGLGAVYESAWMAFRLLAADRGEADVVAFYQRAMRGEPVARALRATCGLSVGELTSEWRAYLQRSARGA